MDGGPNELPHWVQPPHTVETQYTSMINQLQHELDEMTKAYLRERAKNQQLTDGVHAVVDGSVNLSDHSVATTRAMREQIDSLRGLATVREQEIAKLQKQVSEQQATIEQLKCPPVGLTASQVDAQQQAETIDRIKVKHLGEELLKVKARFAKLSDALYFTQRRNEQLSANHTAMAEENRKLRAQVEDMTNCVSGREARLEGDLMELRRNYSLLQNADRINRDTIDKLREEISKLSSLKRRAEKESADHFSVLQDAKEANRIYKATVTRLQDEIESWRQAHQLNAEKIESAEAAGKAACEELCLLRQRMFALQDRHDKFENEAHTLRVENARLNDLLKKPTPVPYAATMQINQQSAAMDGMRAKIKQLEQRNRALEAQVDHYSRVDRRNSYLATEVDRLRGVIGRLHAILRKHTLYWLGKEEDSK